MFRAAPQGGCGRDARSLVSGEAGPTEDDPEAPVEVKKKLRVRNRQGLAVQPMPARCSGESSVNPNRSRQPV